MIFIALTSKIFTAAASKGSPVSRVSARTAAVAKIAELVFYRQVGITGMLGRVALLMIGAGFSYFVGAGLAELMMKAPVPVALMFGAAFAALLSRDSDRS